MTTARGRLLLMLLGSTLFVGCANSKAGKRSVSYRETALDNYKKGKTELADENYLEATRFFTFVKNKFPFSRYSPLAELRIADIFFKQEKYTEAIDAYKLFVRYHPTHPQVLDGYASYRVAAAYIKQMPDDWFLIPPSHEKDQAATRDAVRELKIFVRTYRHSKYLPKLEKFFQQAIRRLADHELYVARFYLERDKPKATILRLEGVLKQFPEAGVHPEVMLLLGKTYLKLNQRKKAQSTFAALVEKYPRDHHAAKAKLYLRFLTQRN